VNNVSKILFHIFLINRLTFNQKVDLVMADIMTLQEMINQTFTHPLGEISKSNSDQKGIYKNLRDFILRGITSTVGVEENIRREVDKFLYSISIIHTYIPFLLYNLKYVI
jgi:hypothetical protein